MESTVHRFDLKFLSYVELKVAWKCCSWTLGDSRSGREKPNGEAIFHVVGFDKCIFPILIWEHYQYWHGGCFCKVDPPIRELHWRKLSKTLIYKINAQWSRWALKTWGRVLTRGNHMTRDQRSWRFVDPTSGFQVMSSSKSHENVVQGHFMSLGPRAKK